MAEIHTRHATVADVPAMVQIELEAFASGAQPVHGHVCRPEDRQTKIDDLTNSIETDPTATVFVAEQVSSSSSSLQPGSPPQPVIVGWSRWLHLAKPRPRVTVDASAADRAGEFSASLRRANRDACCRIMGDAGPYWHLSMLTVSPRAQRMGVGSKLMAYGVDKADEMRQPSYLNATPAAKKLYERFGYRLVDESSLSNGAVSYHMKRPIGGGSVQ